MSVLLVSADLFFGSRVESAANSLSVPFYRLTSCQEAAAHCRTSKVHVVIIDLTLPGLDLEHDAGLLGNLSESPHVAAFGPHVQGGLLAAAEAAGCDEVLTRGQFDSQLPHLLQRWCGNS